MTEPDFDSDLQALLDHHAADTLRQYAHDLFPGHADHELVNLGQIRAQARTTADRLDACGEHLNNGPLICTEHGPHPTHVYAASGADDRHTNTEAVHD